MKQDDSSPGDPGHLSPLDWPQAAGTTAGVIEELERRRRRRRARHLALGAAAALGCITVLWQWRPTFDRVAVAQPAPISAAAVPLQQMLSDGSLVELKPGAEIAVEFTAAQRRVVLKRGTAHFQVAKNAHRPFVVDVGDFEVRAVGTAFSVELGSRTMQVLVTEGRVTVDHTTDGETPHEAMPAPLALVDAGDSVMVDLAELTAENVPVRAVPPAEIDARLAWRAPKLEFSGTPLAEALPMINQHLRRHLVLGDPALGTVRISGILRADNTTALFRLLESDFGITADNAGDGDIVLRKAR
jgi:transmembrane sensor